MTPDEQAEWKIHKARLESSASTEKEKIASRLRLDQLNWAGGSGMLQQFNDRLTAIEELGGIETVNSSPMAKEIANLREDVNDIILRLPTADMLAQVVEDATAKATQVAQEAAIVAVAELMGTPPPVADQAEPEVVRETQRVEETTKPKIAPTKKN